MDIPSALTALSHATEVVRTLRTIDRKFDEAAVRSQMADLYVALADVKIALSDAREALSDRDRHVAKLQGEIAALKSGEGCPLCESGRMKIVSSQPHPDFGFAGCQERTLKCTECGHSEQRFHDPAGVTKV